MMTNKDDVAGRIQRRILNEVRQELAEAQHLVEQKNGEISMLEVKVKDLTKALGDLPAEIDKRDMEIAMLQKRLANLNDEYNGLRGGRTATEIMMQQQQMGLAIEVKRDQLEKLLKGGVQVPLPPKTFISSPEGL